MKWTLAAVAVGLGCVAAAQAVPGLHVPTHGFTQVFGLVLTLLCWPVAARHAAEGDPDDALLAGLRFGAVSSVSAWLAMWGANQLYGCELHHASTYFWLFVLPLVLVGSMLGAALGEVDASRWRHGAALVVVVALCGSHDLAQFMLGLDGYDPLVGPALGLQQRVDMSELPAPLVLHRLWLLLAAAGSWGLWRAARGRGGWSWSLALLGLCAGAVLFGGSRVGLGLGGDLAARQLAGEHRSPRVVVRYEPGTRAEALAPAAAQASEVLVDQITGRFGLPVRSRPITVRLFDTRQALRSTTGAASAHAHPHSIDIVVDDLFDDTLGHELAHVLDPGSWWVMNRGWIEGLAMAWSEGYVDDPAAHIDVASALEVGRLPPIGDVFSLTGFWAVEESLAYQSAGSFLGFLYLTEGPERFLEAVSRRDLSVYQAPLPELEARWHAFLKTVPVPLSDAAKARERLDPLNAPSFVSQTCPKLGPASLSPRERADRLSRRGGEERALELYRELAAAEPDQVRWRWAEASMLQRLERHAEALEVLDALDPSTPDQQLRRVNGIILSALALHDWERLEQGFADRHALEPSYPDRDRVEGLLTDPSFQDVLGEVLTPAVPSWVMGRGLRELAEDYPERPDLAALAYTRAGFWPPAGYRTPTPFQRLELQAMLDGVRARPDLCPLVVDDLIGAVDTLWLHGPVEEAKQALDVLATCELPEAGWKVQRRLERLSP